MALEYRIKTSLSEDNEFLLMKLTVSEDLHALIKKFVVKGEQLQSMNRIEPFKRTLIKKVLLSNAGGYMALFFHLDIIEKREATFYLTDVHVLQETIRYLELEIEKIVHTSLNAEGEKNVTINVKS